MIARLWRGRVAAERGPEYVEYQREVGPPGYRVVPGNRGILMLRRDQDQEVEIVMLTIWESWPAVRAFAGDPVDRARYYERDFDFLIDPPERVEHFEVVAAERFAGGGAVARLWRGATERERQGEARRHEAEIGLPLYRGISGNRGVLRLSRRIDHLHEVAMLTLWDSIDSLGELAGDPPDRASYEKSRRRGLDDRLDLPERVEHFEVLASENFEGASLS